MAHRRLISFPPRDSVTPGASPELVPRWHPDFPTQVSDFQGFVTQIVELAKILTGANGSAIAFRSGEETICRARSGEGGPPVGASVESTSGISKQCLDSGASLSCEDIANDGRVDTEICQAVGIRAVAVVPIYSAGSISGILEVFSRTPGVFRDQHLKMLQQLADLVGSAASAPAVEPTPAIERVEPPVKPSRVVAPLAPGHAVNFLLKRESVSRAFFGNLAAVVSRSQRTPLSIRELGWSDVLIESPLPWNRFFQSVFLHVAVVVIGLGLAAIWPRELTIVQRPLREARITYYPPTFAARDASPVVPRASRRRSTAPSVAKNVEKNNEQNSEPNREPIHVSAGRRTLVAPAPQAPNVALGHYSKPAFGTGRSVLPAPPDVYAAQTRAAGGPSLAAVAPPPEVSGGSRSRGLNGPGVTVVQPSPDLAGETSRGRVGTAAPLAGGSIGASGISVVPPPPSINDHAALTSGARGANGSVQVVGPPPSVQAGASLGGRGSSYSLGTGGSQVVPPSPSMDGTGNSRSGARGNAIVAGGSQVVPPPPSVQGGANYGGTGRANSLNSGAQAVPPPPSVEGAGGTGSGGTGLGSRRGDPFSNGGSGVVGPAPSLEGQGNSRAGGNGNGLAGAGPGGDSALAPAAGQGNGSGTNSTSNGGNAGASSGTAAANAGSESSPAVKTPAEAEHNSPVQDVQLRVISVAWSPPRSSYFSNYEVFIAEKMAATGKPQLIKLVYVFLPYQRRLSEFGFDNSKVRKLRVTRDATCDESLMQMQWPESDKGPSGPGNPGKPPSNAADRNNALPCYRTTADDYRRAVSRSK